MTTVLNDVRTHVHPSTPAEVRIALLGLGNVGCAIAELLRRPALSAVEGLDTTHRFRLVSALVRDLDRRRSIDTSQVPITSDCLEAIGSYPDVVVEVLGGLEPARTLVLQALTRGVPVVTANKSLLAHHGDELFEAAATHRTPLHYEASVLAGVPFLGTFRHRPLARDIVGIAGIVNGTSNFILSRMLTDRAPFREALADAQRSGYAEPDSSKDIDGDDAVEKLCVLLRHFGDWSVRPADIDQTGIQEIEIEDLEHASAFGGAIRPVVAADWADGSLSAFAGPAFVSASNPLARVSGVQNAVSLETRWSGNLFFSGPGAGPAVTAATVLDDVIEAHLLGKVNGHTARKRPVRHGSGQALRRTSGHGWFVRLTSADPSHDQDAPAVLARLGVRLQRTSPLSNRDGRRRQWLLTHHCTRAHLDAALDVLGARSGCESWAVRAIE